MFIFILSFFAVKTEVWKNAEFLHIFPNFFQKFADNPNWDLATVCVPLYSAESATSGYIWLRGGGGGLESKKNCSTQSGNIRLIGGRNSTHSSGQEVRCVFVCVSYTVNSKF
jgi:hypothetical protein